MGEALKNLNQKDNDVISDRKLCTGCAACAQACGSDALAMKEDVEGFLFPEIDRDKCTDCGICRKICPVNCVLSGEISGDSPKKAYSCFIKKDDIRKRSSSGGIFSLLAEDMLSSGGVVFGAGFDGAFTVKHSFIDKADKLDVLRRSKYVQSEIGSMYISARNFLKEGRKVLFCGTPCQIAGLKAYLRRDYDSLLTCDLACHGVPSPKVWSMYLGYMREKYNSEISEISFRDKSSGWKNYNMKIVFKSKAEYRVMAKKETFFIGFGKNVFNRRSCFSCKFRIRNSKADITLADFWGIEKLKDRDFSDNQGVSLVITNTRAGEAALETVKSRMRIREQSFETAVEGNPRLVSSCSEPAGRAAFFADLKAGFTFDQLRRKYMDNFSLKYRIKYLIRRVLSDNVIARIRGISAKQQQ